MDPGPFIANLTLFYYEYKHLDRLYKIDYFSAKRLNNTFRLIDDITSINSDGVFQEHFKYRHFFQKYDLRNKFKGISKLECLFKERRNSDTLNYPD